MEWPLTPPSGSTGTPFREQKAAPPPLPSTHRERSRSECRREHVCTQVIPAPNPTTTTSTTITRASVSATKPRVNHVPHTHQQEQQHKARSHAVSECKCRGEHSLMHAGDPPPPPSCHHRHQQHHYHTASVSATRQAIQHLKTLEPRQQHKKKTKNDFT